MSLARGTVFDIQRYSLHDGPGIRTTVFLKGCPLRCLWCHNPESQDMSPEVIYRESGGEGRPGTRDIAGRVMSTSQVMSEIVKDRIFYDESGGGVTFSGGEPLMQPEFLKDLLEECKEEGLGTTIDTSGFAPWQAIVPLIPLVDTFLYDVKLMDELNHRRYVGASNEVILANLARLVPAARESGKRVLARVPLIPGINDDEENIRSTGEFLRDCSVSQVSVLPYHRMGAEKHRRLGRKYQLPGLSPPSDEALRRTVGTLAGFGLSVRVGG